MKQVIVIAFLLSIGELCVAQDTEFELHENGLIYSDTTVQHLKFIVDSLNLKFKVCDLNRTYLSKLQAKANYISLEKGRVKEAKKDIEANISFDDFVKKYSNAVVERDLLVVRFKYKNYEGENVVEFSSIEIDDKYNHELGFDDDGRYDKPLKGKWLCQFYDKTSYSSEWIEAFYFTEELSQQALPENYARMVQYSDCLVDTSTQVFYDKAETRGSLSRKRDSSKVEKFMDYIHKTTSRPEYTYKDNDETVYDNYIANYRLWDSLRFPRVDSLKRSDSVFSIKFADAVKEAKEIGGSDDEFEEYVGRYYSPKTELELKRNRRVVGGCSMDRSPRIHAFNIALLAAETINWEIFLRAHLDIMNDKFQRASDGSYARGARETYIKELEVLDINVLDLLLGISLRIENSSKNHYFGSIGRTGRALSETNNASEIEAKMLQMISDNKLDDYNRVLIYYLFLNYNYHLEDKEKQSVNKDKLKTAVKTLPEYLATKFD